MAFFVASGVFKGNFIICVAVTYIVFKALNPTRIKSGLFTINNHDYKYFYGDRLKIAGERLNAIQVDLPTYLPHIYVDIHSNNGGFGLQRSFVDIKKYNLEGDFGTGTTVYANHSDRLEVLTVLNPATMSALLHVAKQYDFECIDNRLMLYSGKKVYDSPQDSRQLIDAAHTVVASLHQSLVHGEVLKKEKTPSMNQAYDKFITFGKYGVGSARRIICMLASFILTIAFYFAILATYDDALNPGGSRIVRIILVALWFMSVGSIMYIGLSRKKVDIRWS